MLCVLPGCKSSSKSPPPPKGPVVIKWNTPKQIAQVVIDVFVENGFQVVNKRPENLTFEKPAGKMSDLTYGNWMGDGSHVWRRVKVNIHSIAEATYQVDCAAYNVRDKGGATEEEVKKWGSGDYEKMLHEAAGRLTKKTQTP